MSILILLLVLSMLQQEAKTSDIYTYEIVAEDTGSIVNAEIIGETYIGNFKATAYCGCVNCCGSYASVPAIGASGEVLTEGYSIAADPSVLPLGSEVFINGHKYKVQDTGGAIRGNKIDIYFNNHSDALAFGVQYVDVYR